MDDPINKILIPLGVNLASSTIYDFVKSLLNQNPVPAEQLPEKIHSQFPQVTIDNAKMIANKMIDLLAAHGDIEVKGTTLYSKGSIWMRSAPGTKFVFSDSVSTTESGSEIKVEPGGNITGVHGGQIEQDADGNIKITA